MTDTTTLTLVLATLAMLAAATLTWYDGRAGDSVALVVLGAVLGGIAARLFGNPNEDASQIALVISGGALAGILVGIAARLITDRPDDTDDGPAHPMNTPAGMEPHAPAGEPR